MANTVVPGLSHKGLRTQAPPISWLMQQAVEVPDLISLAAGLVDRDTLPVARMQSLIDEILGDVEGGRDALQYGTTAGLLGLRQAIVERYVAGSAYADPDQVLVTTGSQQFLQLIAEALFDPGDVVIVEDPTYFVFAGVLESAGVAVHGVATDANGMVVEDLDRILAHLRDKGLLERLKLIYTVSYYQNPAGCTLPADRRQALLDRVADLPDSVRILEDAAYYDLAFDPASRPSLLATLDPSGHRVITVLTSSKPFSPGLKTGFGILPPDLVSVVTWLKGNHDFGSGNLVQHVLARAFATGAFDAQIDLLRKDYQRKATMLDTALRESLTAGEESLAHAAGGLYLWLDLDGLPTGPDSALFRACLDQRVLYVPGEYAFVPERGRPKPDDCIRLTYGVAADAELVTGAQRLAAAWEQATT